MRTLLDPLKQLFNICLNVNSKETSAVALAWLPVRTDQELLKIPGYVLPTHWTPNDVLWISHERRSIVRGVWEFVLKIDKQGVGITSIHIHLLKELKLWFKAIPWTDILERSQDFIIFAIFLLQKTKQKKNKNKN